MLFSKISALSRLDFGKKAENKAKAYLKKQGYTFIEANYFTKDGEIDLIFKDVSTLVFVEVRAKRSLSFGRPEETITQTKIMRCKKAAEKYLYEKGKLNMACRFDVVTVIFDNEKWQLTHYQNAFE